MWWRDDDWQSFAELATDPSSAYLALTAAAGSAQYIGIEDGYESLAKSCEHPAVVAAFHGADCDEDYPSAAVGALEGWRATASALVARGVPHGVAARRASLTFGTGVADPVFLKVAAELSVPEQDLVAAAEESLARNLAPLVRDEIEKKEPWDESEVNRDGIGRFARETDRENFRVVGGRKVAVSIQQSSSRQVGRPEQQVQRSSTDDEILQRAEQQARRKAARDKKRKRLQRASTAQRGRAAYEQKAESARQQRVQQAVSGNKVMGLEAKQEAVQQKARSDQGRRRVFEASAAHRSAEAKRKRAEEQRKAAMFALSPPGYEDPDKFHALGVQLMSDQFNKAPANDRYRTGAGEWPRPVMSGPHGRPYARTLIEDLDYALGKALQQVEDDTTLTDPQDIELAARAVASGVLNGALERARRDRDMLIVLDTDEGYLGVTIGDLADGLFGQYDVVKGPSGAFEATMGNAGNGGATKKATINPQYMVYEQDGRLHEEHSGGRPVELQWSTQVPAHRTSAPQFEVTKSDQQWDESKHVRDDDGRFAPKGGAQARSIGGRRVLVAVDEQQEQRSSDEAQAKRAYQQRRRQRAMRAAAASGQRRAAADRQRSADVARAAQGSVVMQPQDARRVAESIDRAVQANLRSALAAAQTQDSQVRIRSAMLHQQRRSEQEADRTKVQIGDWAWKHEFNGELVDVRVEESNESALLQRIFDILRQGALSEGEVAKVGFTRDALDGLTDNDLEEDPYGGERSEYEINSILGGEGLSRSTGAVMTPQSALLLESLHELRSFGAGSAGGDWVGVEISGSGEEGDPLHLELLDPHEVDDEAVSRSGATIVDL